MVILWCFFLNNQKLTRFVVEELNCDESNRFEDCVVFCFMKNLNKETLIQFDRVMHLLHLPGYYSYPLCDFQSPHCSLTSVIESG